MAGACGAHRQSCLVRLRRAHRNGAAADRERALRRDLDIETCCRERGWGACILDGLAVQRWGDPRQTPGVDLTVLADIGSEATFIDPLVAHYWPRVEAAREFALTHRVALVQTAVRVPLDISPVPYRSKHARLTELLRMSRSQVTTCSAEDLVVLKAFAGRPQDWLDIEGILARQGPRAGARAGP